MNDIEDVKHLGELRRATEHFEATLLVEHDEIRVINESPRRIVGNKSAGVAHSGVRVSREGGEKQGSILVDADNVGGEWCTRCCYWRRIFRRSRFEMVDVMLPGRNSDGRHDW